MLTQKDVCECTRTLEQEQCIHEPNEQGLRFKNAHTAVSTFQCFRFFSGIHEHGLGKEWLQERGELKNQFWGLCYGSCICEIKCKKQQKKTLVNALFYFSSWSWTLLLCTNKSKTAWFFVVDFFKIFFLKKAHTNLSTEETFSRKINGWMMILMITLFHLCSRQGTEDFLLLKSLQAEHWSGGGEMRELWLGTTLPERHVFQKSDMSS